MRYSVWPYAVGETKIDSERAGGRIVGAGGAGREQAGHIGRLRYRSVGHGGIGGGGRFYQVVEAPGFVFSGTCIFRRFDAFESRLLLVFVAGSRTEEQHAARQGRYAQSVERGFHGEVEQEEVKRIPGVSLLGSRRLPGV